MWYVARSKTGKTILHLKSLCKHTALITSTDKYQIPKSPTVTYTGFYSLLQTSPITTVNGALLHYICTLKVYFSGILTEKHAHKYTLAGLQESRIVSCQLLLNICIDKYKYVNSTRLIRVKRSFV
jgi:hypothetical protein